MKNIFTLLLLTAISLTSYAQEWERVTGRGPDGCYTTQIIQTVEIKNRGTALDSEKYAYTIKVTFENPLDVGISFDFRYHDYYGESTGRIDLKPGGKTTTESSREISRDIPWETALNIQPVETSKLRYQNFEILGEQIWESKYINCLEHFHLYKKKKMKEISDKLEIKNNTSNNVENPENKSSNRQSSESSSNSNKNSKEQTSSTQKDATINEVSENQGYEVLDVDTSAYEAEKEQKRQQAEQTAQRDSEQITKEDRKEQLKAKQLADAQNFIDNQNAASKKYDAALENLGNTLTQTFNQISNSWAKERDFQSKISSLTNIRSVDASSIISEARSKARQINIEYNRKKDDALNQGVSATQTLINSAENEKQAIVGGVLGLGLTALSQASIEKERKNAQEKLENQKKQLLKKISKKIIDKFLPLRKQHKEAAIYAIDETAEKYHLANYEYAKCMTENANEIIEENYNCDLKKIIKPKKSKILHSSQVYYNTYKRKLNSSNVLIKNNATYFLELAIETDPSNANYLLEKTLVKDLDVYENAVILKRAYELESGNEAIIQAYKHSIKMVKEYLEAEKLGIWTYLDDLKYKYDWNAHNNIKRFKADEKDLFINESGQILFELDDIYTKSNLTSASFVIPFEEFNNNRLRVQDKNSKKYGFINAKGMIVIPVTYYDSNVFSDNKATVKKTKNSEWKFIDINGNEIESNFTVFHIVKRRDNLSKIAKKYKITIEDLIKNNGLSVSNRWKITEGQKLKIK